MDGSKIVVEFNDVSVRIEDAAILSNLTWRFRCGENWGVLGGNGAGKTTFLRLVRGDIWPSPGLGRRIYRLNGQAQEGPIGFREHTGLASSDLLDLYRNMGWNVSGHEAVCTGFCGTPLLSGRLDGAELERVAEVLAILGIEELADRRILSMSQGEAKKILVARAMVAKPRFLLLDEIYTGLDARSRDIMTRLLDRVTEQGTQLMCAAHNAEQMPANVTHVLTLRSGRIIEQGRVSDMATGGNAHVKCRLKATLGVTIQSCGEGFPTRLNHTLLNGGLESPPHESNRGCDSVTEQLPLGRILGSETSKATPESLIQIEDVDVFQEGKRILEQIDWKVEPGQNWALLGRNGSGKTTLLKLIIGELRPLWGGKIRRFGRDDPQTLWEIRKRISLVTPDLQAMHATTQTGLDMVVSGFYGSVGLCDEPTQSQIMSARSWFQRLGLESLENREVRTLSYGQIRMLLVLRAVVNEPRILLLDEPLSGLDDDARGKVLSIIEEFARAGTSVIYVSHRHDQLFSALTHVAVMEKGRMIFQGAREQWQGQRRIG